MSRPLASFTSSQGETEYLSAYDAVRKLWPVPFEEKDWTWREQGPPYTDGGQPKTLILIGSKLNHVEQNVTNGIVPLLKKAVLF